jgi:hypothetical protein
MSKIIFTDANRAKDCVMWVMENIGSKTSVPGSSICGEGWRFWTTIPAFMNTAMQLDPPTYTIELNEHVDEETQLFFMLKWS